MKNYVGECDTVKAVTPSGGVVSGTPVLVGRVLVVPDSTQASGEAVTLVTEGVFLLPKVSAAITGTPHIAAEAWAFGDVLYWDTTNSVLTTKMLGPRVAMCTTSAASTDTTGECMLCGCEAPGIYTGSAVFDATGGKATGTYELTGGALPSGATVIMWDRQVITTFTSATDAATIALGVTTQDTAALKAAIAISNGANPYDAGQFGPLPPATAIKTTAARTLAAVVAVEALTAGKMVVDFLYIINGILA